MIRMPLNLPARTMTSPGLVDFCIGFSKLHISWPIFNMVEIGN